MSGWGTCRPLSLAPGSFSARNSLWVVLARAQAQAYSARPLKRWQLGEVLVSAPRFDVFFGRQLLNASYNANRSAGAAWITASRSCGFRVLPLTCLRSPFTPSSPNNAKTDILASRMAHRSKDVVLSSVHNINGC